MQHRIWQGVRALFAWTRPLDLTPAEALLSPALLALFKRLRRSEQLHSLGVLETLRAEGHDHPDLLVAGLLHDVGKSRASIGLVGRTLTVLVKTFLPGQYGRWARGEAHGWRRAFVMAEAHPAWGAEMVGGGGVAVGGGAGAAAPGGDRRAGDGGGAVVGSVAGCRCC